MQCIKKVFGIWFIGAMVWGQIANWPPLGAEWYYHIFLKISSYNGIFSDPVLVKLKYEKDTTLGGQLCKKLVAEPTNAVYYVYKQGEKVFWYNDTTGGFELLYDFGTPVNGYWVRGGVDTIWVDYADTILINGVPKRRLYVHIVSQALPTDRVLRNPIIEDIGSWSYFFPRDNDFPSPCKGHYSKGLVCYKDSSIGEWGNCVLTGIEEKPKPLPTLPSVRIYPNPATQSLHVESDQPIHQLRLYDVHGKMVWQKKGSFFHYEINLTNISPGFYIVNIQTKEKQIYKKFIKQ